MTNHEHLFVEAPEANLSAGMQSRNGSCTGYLNRRRHTHARGVHAEGEVDLMPIHYSSSDPHRTPSHRTPYSLFKL